MKTHLRILFALVTIAAFLLTSCQPATQAAPAAPAAGTQPTAASSGQQPAAPAAKKEYNIAVIRWDPDDIYFNGVQLGQEQERDRIMQEEGVKINFNVFGANDVSQQLTALQTQVDKGVDGVLLVPWRGEAMTKAVQDLHDKKIPVVVSNALVPQSQSVFVAFDNQEAGKLAGEAIVNRLDTLRGPDWKKGEGVIIELRCIITASFDIGRHTGYHQVLDPIVAANNKITIETREAGCDGAKARKAVEDIISRYGPEKILAVASIDGTMGIGGAVPAFESAGIKYPMDDPKHIPVTTVDASQPELEAINKGDLDHASSQPAVGEGIMTMRLLWQMIKEGKLIDKPAQASTMYADGKELWMPVQVLPSDQFNGPWYKTRTYSVPAEVKVNDPAQWGNMMYAKEKGSMPTYDGKWGK